MEILLALLWMCVIGMMNVAGIYVFAHIVAGFYDNVGGKHYDHE